jgi:hypothetical protein
MYLYLTFLFSNETWRVPQSRRYTRLYYRSMAFTNHLLYRRRSVKIALKPPIERLKLSTIPPKEIRKVLNDIINYKKSRNSSNCGVEAARCFGN